MKGVILAGGTGSRLKPMTNYINKHLLPVFDKPMIFHSLSILLLAGVREIAVVCRKEDAAQFKMLLQPFETQVKFMLVHQHSTDGLPDAILCAKEFIGDEPFTVMLGDNLIFGDSIPEILRKQIVQTTEGNVGCFTYPTKNPESFGILERTHSGKVKNIHEKPSTFISNEAILGLYIFPSGGLDLCVDISRSARGEYEIIDVLKNALRADRLNVTKLGRGHVWMDMGTPETLHDAASFLKVVQERQGLDIGNPYKILNII